MKWNAKTKKVQNINFCPCVLQDISPLGLLTCSHSSLHFFTWSLPAGHWVPLTMCDPWMTSYVCLSVGWELRCKWGLDAPTHRSATILLPRFTCLIPFICSHSFISEVIFNQDCCLLEMNTPIPRWLNRYQWASSKDWGSPSTCGIRAYEQKHLGPTTARE